MASQPGPRTVEDRKPQQIFGFADSINNSDVNFVPKLKTKHHSMSGDDYLLDSLYRGARAVPRHPYDQEVKEHKTPPWQLERPTEIAKDRSLDETPLVVVDTVDGLEKLVVDLNKVREFAVDLECFNIRSFLGITCLVQISTRDVDYVVDPFPVWESMHLLNEPFTNPKIRKVFHGSNSDIICLQRDFGIYVVNMLDTKEFMESLAMPKPSLQTLVQSACGVSMTKEMRTADWRKRPLRRDLLEYARSDTHYLLASADWLSGRKIDGDFCEFMTAVYARCRLLCQQPFLQPRFEPFGYRKLVKKQFTCGQICIMKTLWAWRDGAARAEDERPDFLMPEHVVVSITEFRPKEIGTLRECFGSYPVVHAVESKLSELLQIVDLHRGESADQRDDSTRPSATPKLTVTTMLQKLKVKNVEPVLDSSVGRPRTGCQFGQLESLRNFDPTSSTPDPNVDEQLKRIDGVYGIEQAKSEEPSKPGTQSNRPRKKRLKKKYPYDPDW